MTGKLHGFGVEVVKIAASKNERKQRGPLSAMKAALPFAVGGAISDFPKGVVEEGVSSAVKHGPRSAARAGKTALRRGIGRAGGRLGAGLVSSPVFLSGLKDIKEGDTKRGTAKVVGSGTAFSAIKGGIEAAGVGAKKGKLLKAMKNLAGVRAITGGVGAALTAQAVGRSLRKPKKKRKKKKSSLGRYALPAATGAAIGVPEGAIEEAWKHRGKGALKKLKTPMVRRAMLGGAAGKAAAGAIGAVAITELARRVLNKPKTKTADEEMKVLGPSDVYLGMRRWASDAGNKDLVSQYRAAWGSGEKTPSSRAALYALHDELAARGVKDLRKLEVRPTLKHEVVPTRSPTSAEALALFGAAASPGVFFSVVAGRLKASSKDYVVRDVIERMTDNRGILRRVHSGSAPIGYFSRDAAGARVVGYSEKARPAILAHELGHATAGALRSRTLQNPAVLGAARLGAMLGTLMPLAMTMSMSDKSFTTAAELESKADLISNMGKVTAAIQVPLLAEEALATKKGLGYLARAGGSKLRGLKTLAPAYATYAMPAAFPFLTSAYLRRRARHAREKESQ